MTSISRLTSTMLAASKTRLFLAAALLTVPALLGSVALAPSALAGDEPAAPGAKAGGAPAAHERGMGRFMNRRQRALRLLRALDLTDAQKAVLQEARAAAEPVRKETGEKLRALFQQARAAGATQEDRAKIRAEAKTIIGAARASVEPQAQRILGSLSAEQKAKVAEIATKHGKTMDDARLLKGIERLLLMREGRRARAR